MRLTPTRRDMIAVAAFCSAYLLIGFFAGLDPMTILWRVVVLGAAGGFLLHLAEALLGRKRRN